MSVVKESILERKRETEYGAFRFARGSRTSCDP